MKKKNLLSILVSAAVLFPFYGCSDSSSNDEEIPCMDNDDCTDEDTPVCKKGVCVADESDEKECTRNKDCTNKSRPICNEHGKCVADPGILECIKNQDCKDESKPYCKEGYCVASMDETECETNDDCTNESKPVCSNGTCIASSDTAECHQNSDCKDSSKPVCDNGTCVAKQDTAECHQNSDCKDSSKSVCDNGTCVAGPNTAECYDNSDCKDESKPVCSNGTCVAKQDTAECHLDSDCKDGSKPVCSNEKCIARPEYVADLLDVVFNTDGTAKNIAPTDLVVVPKGTNPTVKYHETLGRTVATFNNSLGDAANSYYRVDYGDYADVMTKIADGHTLEAVVKLGQKDDGRNVTHFFSSTESGGTGFLVSGADSGTQITFLPHVGGGYVSASSGVTPKSGMFYHVVGVYDKSKEKASIYINGELKKSVDAKGDFKFGSETWFGIGADAIGSGSEAAWKGDIAIARVYSDPLSAERIKQLYQDSKISEIVYTDPINVSNIDAMGTLYVSKGYKYYIYGDGFLDGDKVRFESMTGGKSFDAETEVEDGRLVAIIPDDFVTDKYQSILVRGTQTAELASGKMTVIKYAPRTMYPKVVVHAAHIDSINDENSRDGLRKSQKLGVYAVEIDTEITTDGVVYCCHTSDNKCAGTSGSFDINNSTSEQVKNKTIRNGEKVPTFQEMLEVFKEDPRMRLLIHHKSCYRADEMVKKCVQMVKDAGLEENVDHMPDSSYERAKLLKGIVPEHSTVMTFAKITDAKTLIKDNITPNYPDYITSYFPGSFIADIHNAGMQFGQWTTLPENFDKVINRGADFITTDYAEKLLKKTKMYCEP